MSKAISLAEKFSRFDDHWSPRIVAEMNDYQIKIARIEGEFVWHSHADTDELFYVIDGEMTIELPDDNVHLGPGELYVVPRGVEHKPVASRECRIMIMERRGTTNTGASDGNAGEWV